MVSEAHLIIIRKTGRHLFGKSWVRPLARAIGVSESYFHRVKEGRARLTEEINNRLIHFFEVNGVFDLSILESPEPGEKGAGLLRPAPAPVKVQPPRTFKCCNREPLPEKFRFCPYCGINLRLRERTVAQINTDSYL